MAEQMDHGIETAEFRSWLQWALSSAVGWVTGWAVASVGSAEIADGVMVMPRAWVVDGASAGLVALAVAGTVQWLILQSELQRSGCWSILPNIMAQAMTRTIAVVGVGQWPILRHRIQRSGFWWLLANAVGWVLAGAGGGTLAGGGGGVVSGAVNGAITGSVLALLLRRPILESSEAKA